MASAILPPKEYRREMEGVILLHPDLFKDCTPQERDRKARNVLASMKIWERPDYGPLSDLRELVALRIAPWLRAERRYG